MRREKDKRVLGHRQNLFIYNVLIIKLRDLIKLVSRAERWKAKQP